MKDFVRYRSTTGNIGDHWRYTQDDKRHSVKCDTYGWISVDYLKPYPELRVIVSCKDGWRSIDRCSNDGWFYCNDVIGWQPLPEPMGP